MGQVCCAKRETGPAPAAGIGFAPRGGAYERFSTPENEIFLDTLEFISNVPLFQSIPYSDQPRLARAFVVKTFDEGTNVITHGEIGSEFYVVRTGNAKVFVDGLEVNVLGAGDFFGELALLFDTARNATITAAGGPLQCLVISRENFNALDLRKKLNFKRRKAIMMKEDAHDPSQGAKPQSPQDKIFIKEAMQANKFLGPCFRSMTEQQLQNICDCAYFEEVPQNTDIITQGETKADLFYILQHGSAEAFKDGVKVYSYAAGGSFGGLALLYHAPRAATVRTSSDSKLWCIPRPAMRAVLQKEVKDKVAGYAELLGKVRIFDKLSAEDKDVLADALLEVTYTKGQVFTREGQEATAFFVLASGEVSESEHGKHVKTIKAEKDQDFPYFGERCLFEGMPYYTTRSVLSPTATFWVLDRSIFHMILQASAPRADDVRRKGFIEYKRSELSCVGLLGCGGFGKVTLERCSKTGQHFALKKLSKGYVLAKRQAKSVMNEKRILRMTHSPFLIQVAATFNSDQHLFFLLEPALGGELFTVYMVHELHGNEPLALFYSACVTKGLQHLHERCIVYRDMKPENLLLDSAGYCKITDFGLAKFCIGKTFTTCGTPDYFAPELIKAIGHTTALDWWTLGILIFELMTGFTPFSADTTAHILSKMMQGFGSVKFPRGASKWPDLVQALCNMEPDQRLPVRQGGVSNLEQHPWYKSHHFNWDLLVTQKMPAPFLPEAAGDASNFVVDENEAPPEKRYIDPQNGWDDLFEDVWGPESFNIV